jgi:hypothetical protein
LNTLLADRIADRDASGTSDEGALLALVADLERRLRSEANRRAAADQRLARTIDELDGEREQRRDLERRERTLGEELQAVEASFGTQPERSGAAPISLVGLSLLYVGGRTDRIGHLRDLSERLGAGFLHHDGGIEDRSGLLGGLVSRADMVLFPVDCVSHDAATAVKRLCRQMAKPYLPLRSSGMGSFVSALNRLAIRPS